MTEAVKEKMPNAEAEVGESLLEELPPLIVWLQKQSPLLCQSLSGVSDALILMPDIIEVESFRGKWLKFSGIPILRQITNERLMTPRAFDDVRCHKAYVGEWSCLDCNNEYMLSTRASTPSHK